MRWFAISGLVALMFFVGCKNDDTASSVPGPRISSVKPAVAIRGQQNVQGKIIGENFSSLLGVTFGPGVDVIESTLLSATKISVVFSVRKDAAVGPCTVRIATKTGIAESPAFTIGDNQLPNPSFTATPAKAIKNVPITFDASRSSDPDGSIERYDWDFGDGATESGMTVTHSYASQGNFHVTLTVTDNSRGTAFVKRELPVQNVFPPVAHFNPVPRTGEVGTSFSFDGSDSTDSDSRIVQYSWDFRDGTVLEGKVTSHKFAQAGDYSVRLTVTDSHGQQDFVEKTVTVKEPVVVDPGGDDGGDGGSGGDPVTNGCPAGLINQTFTILSVVGNHVIVSQPIVICKNKCADLRRPYAKGALEFAGDMFNIRGNEFDYSLKGFLKACKPPEEGEVMGVVWKACDY